MMSPRTESSVADVMSEQAREMEERMSYALADRYCAIGECCRESGDLERALAAYLRAYHWRRDSPKVHYGLGLVHRQSGRLRAAQAAFRRSGELTLEALGDRVRAGEVLDPEMFDWDVPPSYFGGEGGRPTAGPLASVATDELPTEQLGEGHLLSRATTRFDGTPAAYRTRPLSMSFVAGARCA